MRRMKQGIGCRLHGMMFLVAVVSIFCSEGVRAAEPEPSNSRQMTDAEFCKAVNDFRSNVDRWPEGIAFLQKLRGKTTDKNRLYLIDCAIAEFTLNPTQGFKEDFLDKPRAQLAEIEKTYPDKKGDIYYVYLVLEIRGSKLIPPEELHAFEPSAREIQRNFGKLAESPDILPDGKFFVETMLKDVLARCADLGILNVVSGKLYTREEIISILHKILVNGDVSLRDRTLENLAILRKSAMDDEIKYLLDYTDAKVTLFSCREPRDVERAKIEEAKTKLKEIERNYPDRLQEGTYILLKLEVYGDPYAKEDYKIAVQVARSVFKNWRNGIQVRDSLQEDLRQNILLNCSSKIASCVRMAIIEKDRAILDDEKLPYEKRIEIHQQQVKKFEIEVYKQLLNELKSLNAPEDLIQFKKSLLDDEEARAKGIVLPRRPWSWPPIKPEDLPPLKSENKPAAAKNLTKEGGNEKKSDVPDAAPGKMADTPLPPPQPKSADMPAFFAIAGVVALGGLVLLLAWVWRRHRR